jgi:hypothetical protein
VHNWSMADLVDTSFCGDGTLCMPCVAEDVVGLAAMHDQVHLWDSWWETTQGCWHQALSGLFAG